LRRWSAQCSEVSVNYCSNLWWWPFQHCKISRLISSSQPSLSYCTAVCWQSAASDCLYYAVTLPCLDFSTVGSSFVPGISLASPRYGSSIHILFIMCSPVFGLVQMAAEMITWSHQILVTSLTRHHFLLLTLCRLHGMNLTLPVKLVVSEIFAVRKTKFTIN